MWQYKIKVTWPDLNIAPLCKTWIVVVDNNSCIVWLYGNCLWSMLLWWTNISTLKVNSYQKIKMKTIAIEFIVYNVLFLMMAWSWRDQLIQTMICMFVQYCESIKTSYFLYYMLLHHAIPQYLTRWENNMFHRAVIKLFTWLYVQMGDKNTPNISLHITRLIVLMVLQFGVLYISI